MDNKHPGARAVNARLTLTDGDRAAIDALKSESLARASTLVPGEIQQRARRTLKDETRFALKSAIPDFDVRASELAKRFIPELTKLKGASPPGPKMDQPGPVLSDTAQQDSPLLHATRYFPTPAPVFYPGRYVPVIYPPVVFNPDRPVPVIVQPAFAGDFWWAETDWLATSADGAFLDIDGDPYRIWGHIGHSSDQLTSGNVGLTMFFMLTPDRFPVTAHTHFELWPDLHSTGIVSGWTGFYHPIWAADDKWSKCWRTFRAQLSLSSGEVLDASILSDNQFFLEDESPVGQANTSQNIGWNPILRFQGDLSFWGSRGLSIILQVEFRYDFQLTGDSDLWLRQSGGSAQESVASFDNAIHFRCRPGSLRLV